LKYSKFELLAMFVGICAVLGTAVALVRDAAHIWPEVIGQMLILVALFGGLHYGRKGALISFLSCTAIYTIALFAAYGTKEIATTVQLLILRTVVYAIVAFVAGELNVRLKYLFIKLEHHDYVDDVTSLYNSRYMSKLIDKYISEFDRYGSKFSLATFTLEGSALDNMKKKQSTKIIKDLGNSVIRGNIRGADEAARIEGTKFMILFPNTNHDGATCAGIRVKGKIASFMEKQGIGDENSDDLVDMEIVEYPRDRDEIESLSVNIADSRSYDTFERS